MTAILTTEQIPESAVGNMIASKWKYAAVAIVGALLVAGLTATPIDPPAAKPVYRTEDDDKDLVLLTCKHIRIPVNFNENRVGSLRELILYVSSNRGKTWEVTAKHSDRIADIKGFDFDAPGNGIYWFALVTVDADGQRAPADDDKNLKPALKVKIDLEKKTPPAVAPPNGGSVEQQMRREIADLRKRLDDLEKRLSELKPEKR